MSIPAPISSQNISQQSTTSQNLVQELSPQPKFNPVTALQNLVLPPLKPLNLSRTIVPVNLESSQQEEKASIITKAVNSTYSTPEADFSKTVANKMIAISNQTKKEGAPVALFLMNVNFPLDQSDPFHLDCSTKAGGWKFKPWFWLMQSLGRTHLIKIVCLKSSEDIRKALQQFPKSIVSVYLCTPISGEKNETKFFLKIGNQKYDTRRFKQDFELADKIFLLSSNGSRLAKSIAQETGKEVWATPNECYLFSSHIMSKTGAIIHFDRLAKQVTSHVYTPDGKCQKIASNPEMLEEIFRDTLISAKAGNAQDAAMSLRLLPFMSNHFSDDQQFPMREEEYGKSRDLPLPFLSEEQVMTEQL